MARVKSKKQIVADLAGLTGVHAEDCEAVLDAISELACSEADKGFRIPGLCRFYTVDQKARYGRNPQTGERILIEARKALKISPLKKAKDRIAELPVAPEVAAFEPSAGRPPTIQPEVRHEPQTAAEPPAEPEVQPTSSPRPGPPPTRQTWQATFAEPEVAWLTFNCRHCQQEIEASEDLAGAAAVCPGCGAEITVPRSREEADLLHSEMQMPFDAMADASDDPSSKRKTMRIDLSLDDIEDE